MTPTKEEIVLEEPQIAKHGSKYGVKIKASAPSIHMIRCKYFNEIAPIVGEEYQAKDLMDYIEAGSNQESMGCQYFWKDVRTAGWRRYADEGIKNDDESQQSFRIQWKRS